MESTMISIYSDGMIVDVPKTVVLGFLDHLKGFSKNHMTLESYDLMVNANVEWPLKYDGYSHKYKKEYISSSYCGTNIYFKHFQPKNVPSEAIRRYNMEKKAYESIEYFLIKNYDTTRFTVEGEPVFPEKADYVYENAHYQAPKTKLFVTCLQLDAPDYVSENGSESSNYQESPEYVSENDYETTNYQESPEFVSEKVYESIKNQKNTFTEVEQPFVKFYNEEERDYLHENDYKSNNYQELPDNMYEPDNVSENGSELINHQENTAIEVKQPFVEMYNGSVNVRVEKKPLADMGDAEIDALFAKPPWMRYK